MIFDDLDDPIAHELSIFSKSSKSKVKCACTNVTGACCLGNMYSVG